MSPNEDQQEQLREILARRDQTSRLRVRLADLFSGAWAAHELQERADWMAQSAHSMRELLEKLPLSTGDEIVEHGRTASQRQAAIVKAFEAAMRESSCYRSDTGAWQGEIDDNLRALLAAVDDAYQLQSTAKTRSESAGAFIRAQDPTGEPLPADVEKARVKRWVDYDRYFTVVSHHNKPASAEEYGEQLMECTLFLLELLGTDVLENVRLLDALIAEAE